MKKNLLNALSVVLVGVLIASCGKTTKGKLVGEYQVESHVYSSEYESGTYRSTSAMEFVNGKYKNDYVSYSNNTVSYESHEKSDIISYDFKINKDGTWERTYVLKTDYSDGYSENQTRKVSGSWNFIKESKESGFGKNERVLFNITSYYDKEEDLSNGVVDWFDEDFENYSIGEYTEIYKVIESKKGELVLEGEHLTSSQSKSMGSASSKWSDNGLSTFTLKVK